MEVGRRRFLIPAYLQAHLQLTERNHIFGKNYFRQLDIFGNQLFEFEPRGIYVCGITASRLPRVLTNYLSSSRARARTRTRAHVHTQMKGGQKGYPYAVVYIFC